MVRHGQHPEDAVRGRDTEAFVCGLDALQKRFVGKDNTLGIACRARGEADECWADFGERSDPLGRWRGMGRHLEKQSIGRSVLHEDIEVNLFDEALTLGSGKLGGDGNEAPSGPQDAEGVCDVVRPVCAQESDARARQALDERAEAGGKHGAFFIQFRVGGFTSVVKNGDSAGVGFFENLLGDVHFENAAAAFPAASPVARHVPVTRMDACASCVQEIHRPATKRFA